MRLTPAETAVASGESGAAHAMAMRIVATTGRMLGAESLVAVESAHIDGCLYHGDSGVLFAEKLASGNARVTVPTSLNVGPLDQRNPTLVIADRHRRIMSRRLMDAYIALGCQPSWTCAPYQAGHRPQFGTHIAWGESNAVAFANSVLGARTNRYGDFLDICCALVGRAPYCGLHVTANRRARLCIDTAGISDRLKDTDTFYPVLGAWLGPVAGDDIAVIDGLPGDLGEDRLKAIGAGAAATGSVGLFHVAGRTPEAPTVSAACSGPPARVVKLTAAALQATRDRLSTINAGAISAVAAGSPHFSADEFAALEAQLDSQLGTQRFAVPFYVCTRPDVARALDAQGRLHRLRAAGVEIVTGTCIVVTPILPPARPGASNVVMTNSAKFAQYTPPNTGYDVAFGSLADCVASAIAGRVTRDEASWQ